MIRALACALIVLVLIHVLLAGALVGWLQMTDRLSGDRIDRAVAIFRWSHAQEQAMDAQAAELQAQTEAIAEQNRRLAAVAEGPKPMSEMFAQVQAGDQIARHRVDRVLRETADLRSQIERARQHLAEQHATLERERAAFETLVQERETALEAEDFQQALALLEQLRPRQAKQMLQTLLAAGEQEQVVRYLAAMQLRKSAGILREFKTEAEIPQATALLELLRERGVDLADRQSASAGFPAGGAL